jgi:23S rRNA pseudouridine2605 synthase
MKQNDSKEAPQKGERLQKILARGGIASRRHAESLISAGRVRVNGRVVTELGTRADPRKDKVEVDGKRVVAENFVYVLLHKPRGVVSTMSDPEGRPTVRTYLEGVGARIVPVGRLDFATSGALLMTNDGDFAFALLHPKKDVPKKYVVKVAGRMEERDILRWQRGVRLDDGPTKPADVTLVRYESGDGSAQEKTWIEVVLREGRNQQIRRMGEATGFPVMRLSRTHFAGIGTDGLRPGAWRFLTKEELRELKQVHGVPKHVPADAPKAHGVAPRRTGRVDAHGRSTERADVAPRYGMGSPGRRSYDVEEDYGGTSGRGSSGSRDPIGDDRPPGRGGRSRTTGSGGGIGAGGGSYRMSKSRGRKR